MKTKVLSVAALIIACFGVLSGCLIKSRTSGFEVTGHVYAYGEGLADVKIYANGEFVCASGADGSFSISAVTADAELTFKKEGYLIDAVKVTSDGEITVTARKSVIVELTATDGGTASGGGLYEKNEIITLAAQAFSDYVFAGYYSGGSLISDKPEYSFAAVADAEITAVFEKIKVTVTVQGDNADFVTGAGEYGKGDEVILTAKKRTGYRFIGWKINGETVSTEETYSFTATESVTVTAEYREIPVITDLSFDGDAISWRGDCDLYELYFEGALILKTSEVSVEASELFTVSTSGIVEIRGYRGGESSLPLYLTVDYKTRLPVPEAAGITRTAEGIIYSFGAVNAACDYTVYIDGEPLAVSEHADKVVDNKDSLAFNVTDFLTAGREHRLWVVAVADGTRRDSVASAETSFLYYGSLDRPEITLRDGILEWTAVENAAVYLLSINGVTVYEGSGLYAEVGLIGGRTYTVRLQVSAEGYVPSYIEKSITV